MYRCICLKGSPPRMQFPDTTLNLLLFLMAYHSQHLPSHLRISRFLRLEAHICVHMCMYTPITNINTVDGQLILRGIGQLFKHNLQRPRKTIEKTSLSFILNVRHRFGENMKFGMSSTGIRTLPPTFGAWSLFPIFYLSLICLPLNQRALAIL